jgi:hypothetical protein
LVNLVNLIIRVVFSEFNCKIESSFGKHILRPRQ